MQLVAGQVLVDMTGLEDVGVLQLRRRQGVAVAGDVHLPLARQLLVVAIGSAVEHVGVVGGAHAVEGLSNPEISERLYISTNTVKAHTKNINSKLGVVRRTQAIVRARAPGVLA
ncbi:Transcriptional regulatory protein DevR (DosR) [compost metagenome]